MVVEVDGGGQVDKVKVFLVVVLEFDSPQFIIHVLIGMTVIRTRERSRDGWVRVRVPMVVAAEEQSRKRVWARANSGGKPLDLLRADSGA